MKINDMNPKVSICVPVYNVEQYIERCINSIQNQTIKDIEIVVIDDCTPDHSMDLVENLAKDDARIRIVRHKDNLGLMCARRTGYLSAKGFYITFCDSDDTLPVNAIEILYNNAIKTNADIVSGNMSYIYTNGKSFLIKSELNYGIGKVAVYKALLRNDFRHNLCSKLFKRELLQDYDYKTFVHFTNGEDGCLFYQVINNVDKVSQVNESVYNYYQNIESASNVRLKNHNLESIIIMNYIRVETCRKYKELHKDLDFKILSVITSLYKNNYNRDGTLWQLINKYQLCKYISVNNIFKCNSFRTKLKAIYYIIIKNNFGRWQVF